MTERDTWPELPYYEWKDTYATLHLWLQIVGKIRLVQSPWVNHSWHVTLYPTATGLTTSLIPHRDRTFQIDFDFVAQQLHVRTSTGRNAGFALAPQSVASFYQRLMKLLADLDVHVRINTKPNEVAEPIRFDEDETHKTYDGEYAQRFWRALVHSNRVFTAFRARFRGKCSPVHLFWGAPDLAVTRFSGRSAPLHPGGVPNLADWVTQEAYSHEVSSAGFWPGSEQLPSPMFYSYAYPEPAGYAAARVAPAEAYYDTTFREFFLPYDAVRQAASPDDTLLQFLQTTYAAAADLAQWDRSGLERVRDPRDARAAVQ